MFEDLDLTSLSMEQPQDLLTLRNHVASHCEACTDCPGTAFGSLLGEEIDQWHEAVENAWRHLS